ncbi:MAG: hypothetical protein M3040_13115 [Bacteroidota bacterium]|nr:hypothetical protein [Bacteroidota bacterium]
MKQVAAIFLIALFLFNFFGYKLVFNYLQNQSDVRFEASLDKDEFNEAELITIKVPLSVPYQNNQQNFERVDGELTVNGKIYKYVKRKIYDGQLILKCLPDHEKMKLQSEKDEFFKYSNDLVQSNSSKKPDHSKSGMFKNLVGEYDDFAASYPIHYSSSLTNHGKSLYLVILPSSPHSSPEQPPKAV